MEVDYIIVGQGIMGSLLAAELQKEDQRVFVFDQQANWAASPEAAGMYHPLSGRGLRVSWQADRLFRLLENHYPSLEKRWKARFLYPMPVYRPFLSQAESDQWLPQAEAQAYITSHSRTPLPNPILKNPFGGISIQPSGQLDSRAFLSAARAHFTAQGLFSATAFKHKQCILHDKGGLSYEGLRAKAVIYCEGIGVQHNPFFGSLPLRPLVGEWIEAELSEPLTQIINRKGYLVPYPNRHHVRIGSSYRHVSDGFSVSPTPAGQAALLGIYHSLCRASFRKKSNGARARPATLDRRPWIGRHPLYPSVAICNGLGTKGVSLGPYLAVCMTRLLLREEAPHSEMQLLRKQGLPLSHLS